MEGWESLITDQNERKVFFALTDPKWDFRTVEGIKNDTGLMEEEIRRILSRYPKLVRSPSIYNKEGEKVYTLASNKPDFTEAINMVRAFITKSRA